ncbi:hypothetical protein MIV052L [Invertebrate iridescent virus 3]|uniref:Putative DNA ligase 052L n=1 Tax=Invertebrate iridescent virus 3 TaxID=345201 RepID=VF205_IIV3|nr:NAD-dependent DNA ligase [Invertebrate iridescent virus 3]Q197A8.1 RecName: Full=Putative DNA ligase 052L [Invertebrate iridescent virus 3]ABF82082.1 hypothetical protein MIV052L [Invertebrate iridescent virus 3]
MYDPQFEKYNQLLKLKEKADKAYYNGVGDPIMSDEEYDNLVDYMDELNPDGGVKTKVGASPSRSKSVKLPMPMNSLDKIKTQHEFDNWMKNWKPKAMLLVKEKLDGVSCLAVFTLEQNKPPKIELFTRGDGTTGTNITRLLNHGLKVGNDYCFDDMVNEDKWTTDWGCYLNAEAIDHWKKLPVKKVYIRGELIVTRKNFQTWYSNRFMNARNLVSGQVNKKSPDPKILQDIDFVPYDLVIDLKRPTMTHEVEHLLFRMIGATPVYTRFLFLSDTISTESMADYLERRKEKSDYEIDGLVIQVDDDTLFAPPDNRNPKDTVAFKIMGTTARTTVTHVEWNLSKGSKYKPTIHITPVSLSGVTISKVTGFHGKYISENKIGKGAVVLITRSGEVIPHIVSVISPAAKQDVLLPSNGVWKGVDIYYDGAEEPREITVKKMVHFFTSLGCLGLKTMTVGRLYDAGYRTVEAIVGADTKKLVLINGFRMVAQKLLPSMWVNVAKATPHELMAALNAFGEGIGLRKIQNIDCSKPEALEVIGMTKKTVETRIWPIWNDVLARVNALSRMAKSQLRKQETGSCEPEEDDDYNFGSYHPCHMPCQSSNKIWECRSRSPSAAGSASPCRPTKRRDDWFDSSESSCATETCVVESPPKKRPPMQGYVFVFTRFRDKDLERQITALGGKVLNNVNQNVTHVITKEKGPYKKPYTGKLKFALDNNLFVWSLVHLKSIVADEQEKLKRQRKCRARSPSPCGTACSTERD